MLNFLKNIHNVDEANGLIEELFGFIETEVKGLRYDLVTEVLTNAFEAETRASFTDENVRFIKLVMEKTLFKDGNISPIILANIQTALCKCTFQRAKSEELRELCE